MFTFLYCILMAVFSISIYHLLIFIGRREDYSNLGLFYFGISLCLSIWTFRIFPFYSFFNINIQNWLKILFLVAMPGASTFFLYSIYQFPNLIKIIKLSYLILVISGLITFLFNIFLKFDIFYFFLVIVAAYTGLIPLLMFRSIIKEQKLKTKKEKLVLIGFIGVIITTIIMFKYEFNGILSPTFLSYVAYIFLMLLFAYAIVDSFNQDHKDLKVKKEELKKINEQLEIKNIQLKKVKDQLEETNNTLEAKVADRTYELEQAKNEIELKEQQKTNFFINLAHETKTPLTLIENYLNKYITRNGESFELSIMKINIDKLKNDIVNFFDIEKFNKGKFLYDHNQTIIDLVQVLNLKIPLFQESSYNKSIKLTYESTITNAPIKINVSAIDRILNNIFENSLKYTDNGGQIILKLYADSDYYILKVIDTGIGIPEDQQPFIFEPYYQASHEKKQSQGIGLGLTIVKKIIEEINGKIAVKSQSGKGTEITIQFHKHDLKENENIITPVYCRNDLTPIINTELQEVIHDGQKKNVLLVEDNLSLLAGIQDELCKKYNCYYAINGKDALTKLAEIPKPEIIISDIMMDIMDGYEFYDILKSNPDFKNIPFIFLTAKTALDEKIKGLKKGAVDYILKPVSFEELSAKICSLLNIYKALKEENLKTVENKMMELFKKQLGNNSENLSENNQIIPIENKYFSYKISKREIEIISLIKNGYEYKEIADILHISLNTVETYQKRIFKKCKVNNKSELLQIFS